MARFVETRLLKHFCLILKSYQAIPQFNQLVFQIKNIEKTILWPSVIFSVGKINIISTFDGNGLGASIHKY